MIRKLLILVAVSTLIIATSGTALSNKGLHMAPLVGKGDDLPPNGTMWHEIYPTFCTNFNQHRYIDNGDGAVSVCDYIELVNATGGTFRHHIQEVYTTYVCEPTPPKIAVDYYFESTGDPYTDPAGSFWHAVYPPDIFCDDYEVIQWFDNGNQMVDPCDEIQLVDPDGNQIYVHVIDVSVDIVVDDGTPAGEGAWGAIKSFFGK